MSEFKAGARVRTMLNASRDETNGVWSATTRDLKTHRRNGAVGVLSNDDGRFGFGDETGQMYGSDFLMVKHDDGTFAAYHPRELSVVEGEEKVKLNFGDRVRVRALSLPEKAMADVRSIPGIGDELSTRRAGAVGNFGHTPFPLRGLGNGRVSAERFPQYELAWVTHEDGTVAVYDVSELEPFAGEAETVAEPRTPQVGDRVRVVKLSSGYSNVSYFLRRVGALNDRNEKFRIVGAEGLVKDAVSVRGFERQLAGALFVEVQGEAGVDIAPFLPSELEVLPEPQGREGIAGSEVEATVPSLEDLILELLSIFPNGEAATDILDNSDEGYTEESDFETVLRVVPQLRERLRNHPTEVARRKERKATLRRESREREREAIMARLAQLNELLGF